MSTSASIELIAEKPARIPAPALVIVPSIFGLNDEAHRWLKQYSREGFLTVLYDPFWRTEPGPLSITDDADRRIAQRRRDAFDVERGIDDLAEVLLAVRRLEACDGRVSVVGYCFGGRYAMIAAARFPIQAAVSFHGIAMGRSLDDAREIKVPVSFHFGDADHSTTMQEVAEIQAATRDNPLVEICVYPGVGHSFTWHGHRLHDRDADERSLSRALELLRKTNPL